MKTILAALDAAPSSRDVLLAAAELAQGTGAQLVLFRAGDVPGELEAPDDVDEQRFTERILSEVRAQLEGMRREYHLPSQTAVRVCPGPARQGILKAIQEEHADLVVLGAHGFGSGEGSLGSVTAEIADEAPCSVYVVRKPS